LLNALRRLKTGIVRVLEALIVCIMAVLVLDVLWQVLARVFPLIPSFWTEELATVLLIWVALLGACVAFERKGHLGIDYLVEKLPAGGRHAVGILIHATTALFAGGVLIYGGIAVVRAVLIFKQPLPALGIDMGYVYLALPISGVLILLVAIEGMIEEATALFCAPRGEEA
jgi:TRAP-type C4-dicarboxylate transport system permease small subunit